MIVIYPTKLSDWVMLNSKSFDISSYFSIITVVVSLFYASYANSWRLEKNFNSGVHGTVAEKNSDSFDSAAGRSFYDNTNSYEGNMAAKLHIDKGKTAYGTWGGVIYHPQELGKGQEIWVRIRTYMPTGFNYDSTGEGGHLKFLRVHTQSTSGLNQGYNDWYIDDKNSSSPHKFIFEGEQQWSRVMNLSTRPVLGQWETYEMYLKLDNIPKSQGGSAIVRLWKNGKLILEDLNRRTLSYSNSTSDRTHIFTYWNGGSPKTQSMWIDNLTITNERPPNRDYSGNYMLSEPPSQSRPNPPQSTSLQQTNN